MVVLGVVSDTHDNYPVTEALTRVLREEGVDYVVHLGDFVSPFMLKRVFSGWENRGFAVTGNNDGEIMLHFRIASEMGITLKTHPYAVRLGDKRVLFMHGFGSIEETLELARAILRGGSFDVVLYGHTHQMNAERHDGRLLLNPGEASGYLTGKKTIAILDLSTLDFTFVEL
uniref:Phosphoesterase n=1 Tax=Fervidicoccus fontis TaxID=683846 RepID=A0A7J3ZJ42_9CREN